MSYRGALVLIFVCLHTCFIKPFKPRGSPRGWHYRNQIISHGSNDYFPDGLHYELTSSDVSYVNIVPPPCDELYAEVKSPNPSPKTFDMAAVDMNAFGAIFQQCAPYIAMHRGSTVVLHIPGHISKSRVVFDNVMDDISILHLLGVQIVLVAGVRYQLDEKIRAAGRNTTYHNNMRVTDDDTMRVLKEASGYIRYEIESSLARGFRGKPGQSGINVVSGNSFYSAKPLGVRDGVDFQFTGEVRRIEVENLQKRLNEGDVVMLTSLGYSPSGEVFNVPSESLAAECAARLKAAKIIFLTEGESLVDTRTLKTVQSLRLAQAVSLLERYGVNGAAYNQVEAQAAASASAAESCLLDGAAAVEKAAIGGAALQLDRLRRRKRAGRANDSSAAAPAPGNATLISGFVQLLARCVHALSGGVKRAHLITPGSGGLLKELYTRDGAGMLISRDVYEGIRQAQASDVRAVEEIIKPLEREGILVPRSRDQLEKEMNDCFLLTRDDATLACGMLKRYSDTHAEICCLAVHPAYRREGRGEILLAYLERRALLMNITDLFVLSTRTMQWFEERGFVPSDPELLPSTRSYNASRGSKVYIKKMNSQREIDAEELLWNIF